VNRFLAGLVARSVIGRIDDRPQAQAARERDTGRPAEGGEPPTPGVIRPRLPTVYEPDDGSPDGAARELAHPWRPRGHDGPSAEPRGREGAPPPDAGSPAPPARSVPPVAARAIPTAPDERARLVSELRAAALPPVRPGQGPTDRAAVVASAAGAPVARTSPSPLAPPNRSDAGAHRPTGSPAQGEPPAGASRPPQSRAVVVPREARPAGDGDGAARRPTGRGPAVEPRASRVHEPSRPERGASRTGPNAAPRVQITIGRIEVRATAAPAPAAAPRARPRPAMTLDDYLRGRDRG
jgi:hypothetical protein